VEPFTKFLADLPIICLFVVPDFSGLDITYPCGYNQPFTVGVVRTLQGEQ